MQRGQSEKTPALGDTLEGHLVQFSSDYSPFLKTFLIVY